MPRELLSSPAVQVATMLVVQHLIELFTLLHLEAAVADPPCRDVLWNANPLPLFHNLENGDKRASLAEADGALHFCSPRRHRFQYDTFLIGEVAAVAFFLHQFTQCNPLH